MSTILYYNPIDDQKYERIKAIANKRNIDIIEVSKEKIDYKVGYLLGLEGFDDRHKDLDKEGFDFDFILFSGFDSNELFDLIDELRENKASVSHKAGVTENNIHWSLRELLTENDKEAKTMGLIHKINQLVEKAVGLKEKYGEDEKIKEVIGEINSYFENSEIFEIQVAKKLYLRLLDETLRVENENK
ncbi:MAG: DUF3783 domain-containing protein [Anaerococcus sp.]|nr:DUF3783 domain-containing protein [Anaerococcus sp.]